MGIRSLLALSAVGVAISLAGSASADVPNPTGSGGSTGATTSASGPAGDPNCTVAFQMTAGRTCQECDPTNGSCDNLDNDYHQFCTRTANVAVWCNGPQPAVLPDKNVSCAVVSPGSWGGAAAGALALAAAAILTARRRRR